MENKETLAAFVWRDDLILYKLSETHPLNPIRLTATMDLLRATGLLQAGDVVRSEPASVETLALVHDRPFIDVVQAVSDGEDLSRADRLNAATYGFGTGDNPVFPRMHEAASLIVGATVKAAQLVMSGAARRAFNMSGGLHHAFSDRAAGFCVYNDPAVAIAYIRKKYDARVAYIDIDAHHGDGVQAIFYDDPNVLTVSIHESGHHLFPGTGHVHERGRGAGMGAAVNIPLAPGTGDASWLTCFETIVPRVLREFRPDVLVTQHGCDAHRWDPLTHLSVSTRALETAAVQLRNLADELCQGRWVATGGGGYELFRVVPRAWTMLWAVMAERPTPERLPSSWRERWLGHTAGRPALLRDGADDVSEGAEQAEAAQRNRVWLEQLEELLRAR